VLSQKELKTKDDEISSLKVEMKTKADENNEKISKLALEKV